MASSGNTSGVQRNHYAFRAMDSVLRGNARRGQPPADRRQNVGPPPLPFDERTYAQQSADSLSLSQSDDGSRRRPATVGERGKADANVWRSQCEPAAPTAPRRAVGVGDAAGLARLAMAAMPKLGGTNSQLSFSEMHDLLVELVQACESIGEQGHVILGPVISVLVSTTLRRDQAFVDLLVDLCVSCVGVPVFRVTMSGQLEVESAGQWRVAADAPPLCERGAATAACRAYAHLVGRLLVADWPRAYNDIYEECNPFAFRASNDLRYALRRLLHPAHYCAKAADAEGKCVARAAWCLVWCEQRAGRELWRKWPTECDHIWEALNAFFVELTDPPQLITRDLRSRLLKLMCRVSSWHMVPRGAGAHVHRVHAACQTDAAAAGAQSQAQAQADDRADAMSVGSEFICTSTAAVTINETATQ